MKHVTFTSVARTENRRNLFYWLFEDKKWGWIFYFFGNIFLNLTSSASTNIWQNIPAYYFQKHQSISFLKTFGNFTAKRISIALWKLDSTAGIFLWIHTATYAKTCFCTSSNKIIIFCKIWVFCNFFSSIKASFHYHVLIDMTASAERERYLLLFEHSDIYLQFCIWNDYLVFLIVSQVITTLLLDETCHFFESALD